MGNEVEQDADVFITARRSESRCEASGGVRELREIPLAVAHLRPLSAEAHRSAGRRGKVNSGFMFVGVLQCFGGGGVLVVGGADGLLWNAAMMHELRLGSARLGSAGAPNEKKTGRKKTKGMKQR